MWDHDRRLDASDACGQVFDYLVGESESGSLLRAGITI